MECNRKTRTDDELRAALKHLNYEINMLQDTIKFLGKENIPTPVEYALLESFAIHARVLIHFLYPSGKIDKDDVLAWDFFQRMGGKPQDWPDEPVSFKTARTRVNKEIAHLTYHRQRVKPEDKGWFYAKFGEEILTIVNHFLAAIPPDLENTASHDMTGVKKYTHRVVSTSSTELDHYRIQCL